MKKIYKLKTRLALVVACLMMGVSAWAQVDVTSTGGTPTASYTTLKDAFDAINAGTHTGTIGVGISANTTEIAPAVLNASGAGAASYASVYVNPTVDGITINTSYTTVGRGVIELNGAANVTIDGDNPNTGGANRNLTIINSATNTTAYTSVIRIAMGTAAPYLAANGISVKNCNLNGSATNQNNNSVTSTTGAGNTTFGIVAGPGGGASVAALASVTTAMNASATINSFVVDNNTINQCARGVAFLGGVAANTSGISVINNVLGDQSSLAGSAPYTSPATTVYTKGIYVAGATSVTITGNTIKNILSYIATTLAAIELNSAIGSGAGIVNVSNNSINGVVNNAASAANGILISSCTVAFNVNQNIVTNIQTVGTSSVGGGINFSHSNALNPAGTIDRNSLSNIRANSTGGYASRGIFLQAGNNVLVTNNFIWDLFAFMNNSTTGITFGVRGIAVASGTGHKIYHNTVSLSGSMGGSVADITTCLSIAGSGQTGVDIRNNIFSNTISNPSAAVHTCMQIPSGATSAMNLTVNNNAYYSGSSANQYITTLQTTFTGYTAANFNPLATSPASNMRSYTSVLSVSGTNDNLSVASINSAPFQSPTNLLLNTSNSEVVNNLWNKGATGLGIISDIQGETRPQGIATNPTIGADEVLINVCTAANGGTASFTGGSSACVGGTKIMSTTGSEAGAGITYQWEVSTVGGGVGFSNVSGGTGANTTTYTTGALASGTYFYRLNVTCSNGPVTGYSNEITLTVNNNPTVSVSPSSASYCSPGGSAVNLGASGAVSYAWLPAAGLSATTGANVNASPAATTTYTVTGTDGNGCTNTAIAAITVAPAVIINSITATPPAVCTGGTSNLSVTLASPTASTMIYSATTGNALEVITSPTVVTAVTGGSLDDGYITVAPSFTFNYLGTNITSYGFGTNGYIVLNGFSSAIPTNINTITGLDIVHAFGRDGNLNVANGGDLTHGPAAGGKYVFQSTKYSGGASGATSATIYCTYQIVFWGSTSASPGRIDIIYGTSAGTPASVGTIGIRDVAGTFINGVNGSTSSTATAAAWPTSGQMYSFTMPAPSTFAWTADPTLSATNIANPVASGISTTTTYSVTATSGSCSATGTVTVTVGSPLSSTASVAPSASVCAGSNVTLSATATGGGAPYTYAWAGPNTFASTSQNPVITGVTVAATGTYTVTVTDNCGVNSVSTVALTVNGLPSVTVTPSSASYCNPGTAVALAASGTSTSYAWLPAAGLSATTGANVNASPATTTTYTVTGTDGNGCTNTATTTLTSSPAVIVSSVVGSPSAICSGQNSTLIANASLAVSYCTAGATSTSFEKISNITIGTINNTSTSTAGYENFVAQSTNIAAGVATPISIGISAAYASDDRVHIWVDMNNDGVFADPAENVLNLAVSTFCPACSGTNTTINGTITIPASAYNGATRMRIRLQDQSLGANSTPCGTSTYGQVEDYTLIISGGTANPGLTYAWTPSLFLSSTTVANPTANAMNATTTYTVTVSSLAGCSAQGNTTVTVNSLPAVTASASSPAVCAGDDVTLTGGGASTYTWTGGATNGVAFAPASTNTYTVTGTDGNGCQNTATTTVTVNSLPAVTASASSSAVCAGENVTLTGGGATTYTWTGGVTDATAFTPASTNTYTVTGTDGNGCQNTASTTVTVNSLPTVTATSDDADDAICAGSNITLMGGGATTYVWTGGVTDATAFAPTSTNTYTVTGTDGNGCENTANITITVNALPAVTATSDAAGNTVCDGTDVTLSGNGASTYTWTGGVTDATAFTPTATNTYTVTGTDLNGCTGTDAITITVNSLPTVTAMSDDADNAICEGLMVTLSGDGADTYTWTGGVTDGASFAPTATDTYTVTGTDLNGCSNTATITITVNALPIVDLSPFATSVCDNGGIVSLTDGTPTGGMFSGLGVTGSTFDPSVTGAGIFPITYSVTDGNGCVGSDVENLTVDLCTGIASSTSQVISLYPNPTTGMFTLNINNANSNQVVITIVDMQGKVVYNESDKNISAQYNKQIDLSDLAKGIYYVKLNIGADVKIEKLIVQ
jgi:hypothetical protein